MGPEGIFPPPITSDLLSNRSLMDRPSGDSFPNAFSNGTSALTVLGIRQHRRVEPPKYDPLLSS